MPIEDIPVCSASELNQFFETELFARWQEGKPTPIRIEPEHVNPIIEKAVETILTNNGSYEKGDKVVIHSRHFALDLALEMGYLLKEKWQCQPQIIYNYVGNPSLIHKLISALPNQKSLEKIEQLYRELSLYAQHWVVPYSTLKDEPSTEEKKSLKIFIDTFNRGSTEISRKRETRELKSQDIIAFPVEYEAERLGLSLSEWAEMLWKAMSITKDELRKQIENLGLVKVFGEAYQGKTLYVERKGNYPVNLSMKLTGRPIIMDVGSVGENTLYGKFYSTITNYPPGEIFAAPLEDSVNGEFYSQIPLITEKGIIEEPHVVFVNGRVIRAEAKRGEEALFYYTGLERPDTPEKRDVYAIQNTVAEFARGLNPFLNLMKTTGSGLIDEKMNGIHIATGANKFYGGANLEDVNGLSVEHKDFIVGPVDRIYCL